MVWRIVTLYVRTHPTLTRITAAAITLVLNFTLVDVATNLNKKCDITAKVWWGGLWELKCKWLLIDAIWTNTLVFCRDTDVSSEQMFTLRKIAFLADLLGLISKNATVALWSFQFHCTMMRLRCRLSLKVKDLITLEISI